MPRNIFSKSNKSQASLEKIQDPRDHSPPLREQHLQQQAQQAQQAQQRLAQHLEQPIQEPSQVQVSRESEATAYPQAQVPSLSQQQSQQPQQGQYSSPTYHQHPQSQPYTIQSTQPAPQDERYYQESPQSHQPPAHLLVRSSSNHQSSNAYQEHQQVVGQRPTIALVNPNLQQESIAEDDRYQPGQTQFGTGERIRTSGPKEEKKSRNSGLRGLFSSSKDKKEGRDTPSDSSRLSRHSSLLKGRQQAQTQQPQSGPQSPQTAQYPPSSPKFPQSPSQGRSDPIAGYTNQQIQGASSQEDLSPEDRGQYEQFYRQPRPNSQYELPSQQEAQRPSIPYEEDVTHYPPPQQVQPYHQQQPSQQIYHHPNVSQTQIEPPAEDRKDFFQYPGQPPRDRPSAVFEADQSLRPPSQSSLGPPSPLGAPASLASRQSTVNPPRYSTQSQLAYQVAQQEASKIQGQQTQTQPQQAVQGGGQLLQVQDQDMPNRGQQRDSRMDDQDHQRYQTQDPRVRMSTAATQDQGRSTPPPRGRDDIQQLDHQTLLARYEELQQKYSKVKRYYFDREAQVTQLQNTVANQRLSMSKTSLDDAQYATRFERLNGAIQNLAFNIRKDWRRIPNWLAPACNRDACQTGTKEMTAVGRASISRWLFEHIFQSIFHPGIDQMLSQQLKHMERTLRRTPSILTEEQRDDLLTKVTTWRLTTCESLADVLNSRQSEAYTESLSRELADQLTAYLLAHLNDPAPPNLEGYLLPIVSQTLSIAANLPLESRDICIDYYFPGSPINEIFMKLETGMTALVQPGSAPSREDFPDENASMIEDSKSVVSDADGTNVEDQIRKASEAAASTSNTTVTSTGSRESSKHRSGGFFGKGFSGGLVGSKKPPQATGRGPSQTDLAAKVEAEKQANKEDEHTWTFDAMCRGSKEGKIRFAVFLAVEVRGKAPGKAAEPSSNGNGNGEAKNGHGNGASAGPGVTSTGGTGGGAGTGGVNVLYKAPIFAF